MFDNQSRRRKTKTLNSKAVGNGLAFLSRKSLLLAKESTASITRDESCGSIHIREFTNLVRCGPILPRESAGGVSVSNLRIDTHLLQYAYIWNNFLCRAAILLLYILTEIFDKFHPNETLATWAMNI